MNTRGEVVGVVTATLNQITALKLTGSLPQNVNYAVKTDYILPLIRSNFPELESQGLRSSAPSSPLKKSPVAGIYPEAKHNAAKAISPSCETMRKI